MPVRVVKLGPHQEWGCYSVVKTIFYTAGVDETMLGLRRDGTVKIIKLPPRQFDPMGSTPERGDYGMMSMRRFINLPMLVCDFRIMML